MLLVLLAWDCLTNVYSRLSLRSTAFLIFLTAAARTRIVAANFLTVVYGFSIFNPHAEQPQHIRDILYFVRFNSNDDLTTVALAKFINLMRPFCSSESNAGFLLSPNFAITAPPTMMDDLLVLSNST